MVIESGGRCNIQASRVTLEVEGMRPCAALPLYSSIPGLRHKRSTAAAIFMHFLLLFLKSVIISPHSPRASSRSDSSLSLYWNNKKNLFFFISSYRTRFFFSLIFFLSVLSSSSRCNTHRIEFHGTRLISVINSRITRKICRFSALLEGFVLLLNLFVFFFFKIAVYTQFRL